MKPFWLFKKIKNKCPVWQVLVWRYWKDFLTPTHSLVLTLILHKSHTELHWVWDSLLSRHHQTYFGQPPSHHPLLLCTTPLILSGMPQALKHPLFSSLLFSSVFYLQRLLIYFHPNLPNLWLWLSKFRLATDYCEMPFRKHSHQRVFFSSGLCTKVVCVEAVRRAPALIRHKWRKAKNHSALLRWAVEPLSCIWLFISVFPLGLRAVHLSKKRHCKS